MYDHHGNRDACVVDSSVHGKLNRVEGEEETQQ